MQPAIVFPYNDPDGVFNAHLEAILPDLKAHFGCAWVSLPEATAQRQPELAQRLAAEAFFRVLPVSGDPPVGTHFTALYRQAAEQAHPEQVLHLAYLDRLSFALRTAYRETFWAEIDGLGAADTPVIFERSAYAWSTHPRNYAALEGFVTQIGERLFRQSLDYGWCHLALTAGDLRRIMAQVTRSDLALVAEMILLLQPAVKSRAVDWLAWEDPFIFQRAAEELKAERESSLVETQKRLSYVLPMVDLLVAHAQNHK